MYFIPHAQDRVREMGLTFTEVQAVIDNPVMTTPDPRPRPNPWYPDAYRRRLFGEKLVVVVEHRPSAAPRPTEVVVTVMWRSDQERFTRPEAS